MRGSEEKEPEITRGADQEMEVERWEETRETSGEDGAEFAAEGRRVCVSALRMAKSDESIASRNSRPRSSSSLEYQLSLWALKSPTMIASPSG